MLKLIISLPWHGNAHVLDVLEKVFDPIQPSHDYHFSKAEVEDGVGSVVVEEAEHEDAGGEAAGETSKEGKDATEWKVGIQYFEITIDRLTMVNLVM